MLRANWPISGQREEAAGDQADESVMQWTTGVSQAEAAKVSKTQTHTQWSSNADDGGDHLLTHQLPFGRKTSFRVALRLHLLSSECGKSLIRDKDFAIIFTLTSTTGPAHDTVL